MQLGKMTKYFEYKDNIMKHSQKIK